MSKINKVPKEKSLFKDLSTKERFGGLKVGDLTRQLLLELGVSEEEIDEFDRAGEDGFINE